MEIHSTRRQAGSHRAPAVPSQRVAPLPMPVRVPPAPQGPTKKHQQPMTAKKPRRWGLLLVPLGLLLVAGAVLGAMHLLPGAIDNAQVGDCASFDRSNPQSPYATVRCGSSAAAFVVLGVIDGEGSCRDVAGATRSTISTETGGRREVCMGPKNVDPATAVNVAQVGDCLTGATGQERRVPCDDPTATVKILKRVNDLSTLQVPTACDNVPGATSVYSWTWDSDDGTGPAQASYQTDAVFCLGRIR
jgi:hypothetical protein